MMNHGTTWTALKQGREVGKCSPRPPFANKMICITIPYCKHGDAMMLLCEGGSQAKAVQGLGSRVEGLGLGPKPQKRGSDKGRVYRGHLWLSGPTP